MVHPSSAQGLTSRVMLNFAKSRFTGTVRTGFPSSRVTVTVPVIGMLYSLYWRSTRSDADEQV